MHTLNELDLVRQRRDEIRREVENNRLARRLRSAGAEETSGRSLLTRLRDALRPAPKEVSVGDCEG